MNSAVFVDFENLFDSLKGRSELTQHRTRDVALGTLENLKTRLQADGTPMVLGRSYASFDTYPGMEVAHDLALMGFDPTYTMMQPSGRNAASVQIAVDVCRVLYRRPDIETIVVVAGGGDYIPIARVVLEENRGLRVVALPDATSGDLRLRVGPDRFLSALDLLPEEPASSAGVAERATAAAPVADPSVGDPAAAVPGATIVGHIPVTWDKVGAGREVVAPSTSADPSRELAICLDLVVQAQERHGTQEIWLSPFLKGPMTQAFSGLLHPQRRALINELRNRGAIRVEVRENQFADHPYSVIVLQEAHPWVVAALGRRGRG